MTSKVTGQRVIDASKAEEGIDHQKKVTQRVRALDGIAYDFRRRIGI